MLLTSQRRECLVQTARQALKDFCCTSSRKSWEGRPFAETSSMQAGENWDASRSRARLLEGKMQGQTEAFIMPVQDEVILTVAFWSRVMGKVVQLVTFSCTRLFTCSPTSMASTAYCCQVICSGEQPGGKRWEFLNGEGH